MKLLALWLVTCLYTIQAAICVNTQPPQAMIIFGYVIANLGLIWSMS